MTLVESVHTWIAAWQALNEQGGKCGQATLELQAAFPEVERVCGHVLTGAGLPRPHWWCVLDGAILDPTADQFDTHGGIVVYEPMEEVPIGLCANCGGYSFASKGGCTTICSETCGTAFCASMKDDANWGCGDPAWEDDYCDYDDFAHDGDY